MQIGIISDIHGNQAAYDAVIDELTRLGVDEVICLGDAIDPLPGSQAIFRSIFEKNIPFIRGNHEDYIVLASENPLEPAIADAKFKPVHLAARTFSESQIKTLKSLPLSLTRHDPVAGEVFLCHASPLSNRQGWKGGQVDPFIKEDLEQISARVCVGGHWHLPGIYAYENKTLVSVGSVGIPFNSKTESEFLILEAGQAGWGATLLQIPYDVQRTLQDYQRSGWLAQGAPISLLYCLEISTGQRSMAPLFHWQAQHGIEAKSQAEWLDSVHKYLRATGRWELLEQKFTEFSLGHLQDLF